MSDLALIRSLRQRAGELEAENRALKEGDGGGTSGGMASVAPTDIYSRVGRLEMGFCAAFVLIFGAIIAAYLLTSAKFDAASTRLNAIEVSAGKLESKAADTERRLAGIEGKIDVLLERVPAKR